MWRTLFLLLVGACGGAETDAGDTITAKLPPAKAAAQPPTEDVRLAELPPDEADRRGFPARLTVAQPHTLRSSHYTSLEPSSCKLLDGSEEEGASLRRRCAGWGGYALETSEMELRRDLAILSPDGRRFDLNLSGPLTDARLGKTAEWRSEVPGQPRALIVRVNAAANSSPRANISNLIVTRLDEPACVVAVVPRGPRQNEKARAIADRKLLECM